MNEREIFEHAQQIEDLALRAAYIQEACGKDHALATRVAELLAALDKAGSFLESPAGIPKHSSGTAPWPNDHPSPSLMEQPGDIVAGKYKLLQVIGEGGMGVVYMAEQRQPIVRRVALKIIKPGLQSAEIVARFEAEQQALAVMDHPHIAKVFDAGQTNTGLPFLVMELVNGIPITRYCDSAHLSISERLALFVTVCQAVQHAHHKGVVHRDIKPSNVLVTQYDGKPVAKVIDFGVAKAIGHKLTDKTLFTRFGSIVGTLEYMSPEQATLNALDVDTRSDIYSLGVLLYELLTGATPMDRLRLQRVAFDEVLQAIRHEEPVKPSTRLSSSVRLPSIAAERRVEPQQLASLIRGDLDWVVMKALEKERDRRYDTAKELAEDLERHLACQPVVAGPPSPWYRLQKFFRRNRSQLLAAGSIGAILLVSSLLFWRLANQTWRLDQQLASEQRTAEMATAKVEHTRYQAKQQQIVAASMASLLDPDSHQFPDASLQAVEAGLPGDGGAIISQAMKLGMEGGQLLELEKPSEAIVKFDEGIILLTRLPKPLEDPDKATEDVARLARSMLHSGRGQSLDLLRRADEAEQAWATAIEAATPDLRADVQSERLTSLLKIGNMAQAVTAAESWTNEPNPTAQLLATAARVYAHDVAESNNAATAATRSAQAIAWLEQAEEQGYFTVAWRRDDLAQAGAWKSLRGTDRFDAILTRITANPPKDTHRVPALIASFNLIFAAANTDQPSESAELLDQAMARLESILSENDEDLRLYLAAARKVVVGNQLKQQGETEAAALTFDAAHDILEQMPKSPAPLRIPAATVDALRQVIDSNRHSK